MEQESSPEAAALAVEWSGDARAVPSAAQACSPAFKLAALKLAFMLTFGGRGIEGEGHNDTGSPDRGDCTIEGVTVPDVPARERGVIQRGLMSTGVGVPVERVAGGGTGGSSLEGELAMVTG